MNWIIGIWLSLFVIVIAISGCPGQNSVVDWPTERLDSNSSVASSQPAAAQVADLDGDGRSDAVSVWRGSENITGTKGTVKVNFQAADGTWDTVDLDNKSITDITKTVTTDGTPRTITSQIPRYVDASAISVADANQDGRPDLLLVASGNHITYLQAPADAANAQTPSAWTITDIVPTGTTTVTTTESTITTEEPLFQFCFDAVAGNIDGKNSLDIVASLNDIGRVVWLESPADPTISADWILHNIDPNRTAADSIKLLDMNGDGMLDVVSSASPNTTSAISWYEHPADLSVSQWTKHIMTSFSGATRFDFGDLDGDGTVDMAAISPITRQVAWFPRPSDVNGVWNGWILADYSATSGDTREPVDISIADMNSDGQLDVVVVSNNPASVFYYSPRADNKAAWSEHRVIAIDNFSFGLSAVSDILNRGLKDVIVPATHDAESSNDQIDRFINPGQ